jgi:hypothetical protein
MSQLLAFVRLSPFPGNWSHTAEGRARECEKDAVERYKKKEDKRRKEEEAEKRKKEVEGGLRVIEGKIKVAQRQRDSDIYWQHERRKDMSVLQKTLHALGLWRDEKLNGYQQSIKRNNRELTELSVQKDSELAKLSDNK